MDLKYPGPKHGALLLSVGVVFLEKDKGGFKVYLPQVWSFALSIGVVFLGKTNVDLKYLGPKRGASP